MDGMLRGQPLLPELRYRDDEGKAIEVASSIPARSGRRPGVPAPGSLAHSRTRRKWQPALLAHAPAHAGHTARTDPHLSLWSCAQPAAPASQRLHVPANIVDTIAEGQRCSSPCGRITGNASGLIKDAENRRIPVYVLRANTVNQMEGFLSELFNLDTQPAQDPAMDLGLEETQQAIRCSTAPRG